MHDCPECGNGYATLRGLQLHRKVHPLRVIHAIVQAAHGEEAQDEEDFGGDDSYDFSWGRERQPSDVVESEESAPEPGDADPTREEDVEEDVLEDMVSVTFGKEGRSSTPPPTLEPPSDNPFYPFANSEEHYWAQWAAQYNLPATCLNDMFKLQDFRKDGRVFESAKSLHQLVEEIPQEVPLRFSTVEIVVEWTREEREKLQLAESGQSRGRRKQKAGGETGVPKSLDGVKAKFSFIPLRTALMSLASNTTFASSTDWTSRRIVNSVGHQVLAEPRDGTIWGYLEKKLPVDQTLAHGILACDKVSRGGFASRKKGYPIYFSLGNIQAEVRNKINSGAMLKIGSLPVFEDLTKEAKDHPLFPVFYAKVIFACFKVLLDSLKNIEDSGLEVTCGDGRRRSLRLVIASIIADYPEQCLLSAVYEGRCPLCSAKYGHLDDHHCSLRDHGMSQRLRKDDSVAGRKLAHLRGYRTQDSIFDGYALHNVYKALTPDTLHQVKLVFVQDILGNVEVEILALPFGADLWNEVQRRFLLQFPFPELLFFARGTGFANWNGDQCGQCIKIFPGIIAGLGLPASTTAVVRAYAEIFMIARFRRHSHHLTAESPSAKSTPTTIDRFEAAHQSFLDHVNVGFANSRPKGIGNLRRIHSWAHYKLGILRHGSLKGVSSEGPERLHQTEEKEPYNASSKKRTAESEILLRNENRHALRHLQQKVEAAGVPSMEEIALASQPGRRRRRGKVVLEPGAGVRTGSDDYRNEAVLTGTPVEIAVALSQPALTKAILNFTSTSPLFRNNRKAYYNPTFTIRTFGLFYTSFVRPDPALDPTFTPEEVTSCIRARPTWNYSDEDGMVAGRYDFVCVKSESDGVVRHKIGRVKVIFRFHRPAVNDPFVLVEWLSLTSTTPDAETGWLRYSKTEDVEIVSASRVVSNVALQPVFSRESLMKRIDAYERHEEFFLMKGVTDELYDYFHEFQDTFVD